MSDINYSSLLSTESDRERRIYGASRTHETATGSIRKLLLVLFILVAGLVGIALLIAVIGSMAPLVGMALVPVGLVVLVIYTGKRNKRYQRALEQFVRDNGWSMGGAVPDIPFLRMNGFMNTAPSAIFSGALDGLPFCVFTTEHAQKDIDDNNRVYGSGDSIRPIPVMLLSVGLPKVMPELMLLPHTAGAGLLEKQIAGLYNLERIELEGDFDNHIRLYAPFGQQIDALSYITPDVMAALLDAPSVSAIILSGSYLVIAGSDTLLTYNVAKSLFGTARAPIKELKEKQNVNSMDTAIAPVVT